MPSETRNIQLSSDFAIVGMGPRGLSVLERLLVRLAEQPTSPVTIWMFDPEVPGAGRIWRSSQPKWFMMNTTAGEVSLYSGSRDGGPARAGHGPSLAEWLREHPDPRWSAIGPNDYAPRAVYGEYLNSVYNTLCEHAPEHVTLRFVQTRVEGVGRYGSQRLVHYAGTGSRGAGAYSLPVDKVVLTTGHPRNRPGMGENRLVEFAQQRPAVRYLPGDSAADLPLDEVAPGERVGIIGLGLTFFDVLMDLTVGRGGEFHTRQDGTLSYRPSGREPQVFAGSRSGLVMRARGRNQKAPDYRYNPVFVTDQAIATARRRAQRQTGSVQLDFRADVLPPLQLEVEHVYYTTHVRRRQGAEAADRFAARHRDLGQAYGDPQLAALLDEFEIGDVPPVDLERLARPFRGEQFASPAEFHDRLTAELRADLVEAEQGNVTGPLKAALDILRDTRGWVRKAVDFGGLRPKSHRDDFLGWFNPINTMVSAGPPAIRVAQALALIESGILVVLGPEMRVACNDEADQFVVTSPRVHDARYPVTTLIDARIPRPQVGQEADTLIPRLLTDGVAAEYVNCDPLDGDEFATGGLAVTKPPFRVVDSAGHCDPHLYLLGIPTENTRWFTQIGNGRPGPLVAFHADADAIAQDMLGAVSPRTPARPIGTVIADRALVPASALS